MNIPSYMHTPMVDKNGMPTDTWQLFFTQLLNQMQTNLSNQGFILPPHEIATVSMVAAQSNGAMVYVQDPNPANDSMQVRINGVYKKVTVT